MPRSVNSVASRARRKKVLSDSTPLDDNGWSASKLADPVAKKEQLRRLKDEAKKQDEERKTNQDIEKWKAERVKALEKMDAEERKVWLEAHREEIEADEKKVQAAEAEKQAELRELVEQVKESRAEASENPEPENRSLLNELGESEP